MPRFQIFPDSQRDSYSPTNGSHNIRFTLPSSGAVSGCRLNGEFYLAADPGANEVQLSSAVGIQSVIAQVQIVSSDGQVLEDMSEYARTISSVLQTSLSTAQSALTSRACSQGSTGCAESAKLSLKGCTVSNTYKFSLKLHTGLLSLKRLPLSRFKGCSVNIRLSPDANVLAGTGASATYYYSLKNISMTGVLSDETPDEIKSKLVFPTIVTIKNSIRGGRSIQSVSVPEKCVSAWQTYMLAAYDGNYLYNSYALMDLPSATMVNFTYGGAQYPHAYPIRTDRSLQDAELTKGFASAAGRMTLMDGASDQVSPFIDLGSVSGTGVVYHGALDLSKRKFGLEVVSGVTSAQPYSVWMHFRTVAEV